MSDHGHTPPVYCCNNCGWAGSVLDMTGGVVETDALEAISTRVCPMCGNSRHAEGFAKSTNHPNPHPKS